MMENETLCNKKLFEENLSFEFFLVFFLNERRVCQTSRWDDRIELIEHIILPASEQVLALTLN